MFHRNGKKQTFSDLVQNEFTDVQSKIWSPVFKKIYKRTNYDPELIMSDVFQNVNSGVPLNGQMNSIMHTNSIGNLSMFKCTSLMMFQTISCTTGSIVTTVGSLIGEEWVTDCMINFVTGILTMKSNP